MRQGYVVVKQRYSEALDALKMLTQTSLEAAKRAAVSAEKSAIAAKSSARAASVAASEVVIFTAEAVKMSSLDAESPRLASQSTSKK